MKIIPLRLLVFVLLFPFLYACSDESEPGPQGPQGPQGETGPQGPKGDPGDSGEGSSSTVIYSGWLESGLSLEEGQEFDTFFLAEDLGYDLDETAVLVYGRGSVESVSEQIPAIINGNIYYISIIPGASGSLKVGAEGTSPFNEYTSFRYVIIPGTVPANGKIDYHSMTYDEITDLFNIPK